MVVVNNSRFEWVEVFGCQKKGKCNRIKHEKNRIKAGKKELNRQEGRYVEVVIFSYKYQQKGRAVVDKIRGIEFGL